MITKFIVLFASMQFFVLAQNHECSEFSLGGCNDGDSLIFDNPNVKFDMILTLNNFVLLD